MVENGNSASQPATLTINNTAGATFSGTIRDGATAGAQPLGLAVNPGAGNTFTLTGNNSFTGTATVAHGSLQGSSSSLTGSVALPNADANVTFNQTAPGAYFGSVSGSGSLTKTGGGVLTVLGLQSYTGPTIINQGTLSLGQVNSVTGLGGNGAGWTLTSNAVSPITIANNVANLTTQVNGIANSMWYNTQQQVLGTPWTAKFTYTDTNTGAANAADGGAFVLQTSSSTALGGGGGAKGVGNDGSGNNITPSAEVVWNIYNGSQIGYLTGGNVAPLADTTPTGVNVETSGSPVNFTVSYDGSGNVTVTAVQGSNSWSSVYSTDLAGAGQSGRQHRLCGLHRRDGRT